MKTDIRIGPPFQDEGDESLLKRLFYYSVIENHAQLIRFVKRKEMTSQEAAKISIKHAVEVITALEEPSLIHSIFLDEKKEQDDELPF